MVADADDTARALGVQLKIVEASPTVLESAFSTLRAEKVSTSSSAFSLSTVSSYAHLHEPWPRSENPGVGGSIPSQPTIHFFKGLAHAARTRRARSERLTRTVLGMAAEFPYKLAPRRPGIPVE